ncbi:MAG: ThuA domain-containing protein [Gemmataceae bacterium]|nr:ThuA domain-containing protein [Gemmataceae bacterium]
MSVRWLCAAVLVAAGLSTLSAAAPEPAGDAKKKRLLLVTHSGGFIHKSVVDAEKVLKEVGPKHGYDVTCWRYTGDPAGLEKYSERFRKDTGEAVGPEHCGRVNKDTLKNFDVVLFFTTGDPVNKDELQDLTDWVKAGGAFAGTHCATDTLYNDSPYGELIGAYFKGHPKIQEIKVKVEDPKHPAAAGFADGMPYTDEMYVFRDEPYNRGKLHVILSLDPASLVFNDDKQRKELARKDNDYAISWTREVGKGKVFYTSFGHRPEVWKDAKTFHPHLFGGLDWATGKKAADAGPSKAKVAD